MMNWIDSLTTLQTVLFGFGCLGSLVFLVQLAMMLVGIGDADGDVDVGGGADLDGDVSADLEADAHGVHADSDVAFKVFTVQGVVAFFMMLGWVGLALNRASGYGVPVSLGVGSAAGLGANFLLAKAFQGFKKMQSSGTMEVANAVGQEGNVYLGIRKDVGGKVQAAVQGHLRIFDAVSEDGEEIPTGTRVVVVKVVKGNTMVVKRV